MTILLKALTFSLLVLLLAACGGQETQQQTGLRLTAGPTRTNTPRPTGLAEVTTLVPAGFPENPLRLAILPVDDDEAMRLEEALEDHLLQISNVTVDIVLIDRYAQALQALCDSNEESVTAIWADGLTFAAAIGQNCGSATLQIEQGEGRQATTGRAGVLVMDDELQPDLGELSGATFCRIGFDDFFSWILPNLMMRAADFDPLEMGAILEFENFEALLNAVAQNRCAATGVPADVFEEWMEDSEDALVDFQQRATQTAEEAAIAEAEAEENEPDDDEPDDEEPTPTPTATATLVPLTIGVQVVASSVEFPFGVMVFPFETPLAARLSLSDALLGLEAENVIIEFFPDETDTDISEANTPADADAEDAPTATAVPTSQPETVNVLEPFFGDAVFRRVEIDDFEALNAFLEQTGLDFSQLGN